VEVDGPTSILGQVVPAHVELAAALVIDKDGEHVAFDGALLVQAWNEELSTRVLSGWRKTNYASGGEALEVSLCDDVLEKVVGHAAVAELAVLHKADLILGIVPYH
jgi:hypothetical protein